MDLRGRSVYLVTVLLPFVGCQRYAAQPLDRGAHRASFLERTPDAPEVADFARRLADTGVQPSAFDPSDGLSLVEGEAVALVYNRDLRLSRLRAGVSAAAARHAGLWEDPVLSADLTRILPSTDHPWKAFGSLGFTIPISGRLAIEKKRAGQELRAAIVRTWAQEWATRITLRTRWVEWSAAREQAAVMRGFLERLDQIVEIVDRVAQAGEMSRVEARLFRVERVMRGAELAALDSKAASAELALRDVLGLAPGTAVELLPSLNIPARDGEGPVEPPDTNATLATARAEYDLAERTLELEVRRQYPDLTIGPGFGREDGQNQILLGLSIPLPLLNRNRQAIAMAVAQRGVARTVYETEYERIVSELAQAVLANRHADRQLDAIETQLVPLVDEQYADTRRIAELGEVNTPVLLESLTRQQEAKLQLIEARAAASLARVRIDELMGPATEPPAEADPAPGAKP